MGVTYMNLARIFIKCKVKCAEEGLLKAIFIPTIRVIILTMCQEGVVLCELWFTSVFMLLNTTRKSASKYS